MDSCCGAERRTTFCPDCGKRLGTSPLHELLVHCQKRAKLHESDAQRHEGFIKEDDPCTEWHTEKVVILQQHAERWRGYVVALEEAIAQKEDDDAE